MTGRRLMPFWVLSNHLQGGGDRYDQYFSRAMPSTDRFDRYRCVCVCVNSCGIQVQGLAFNRSISQIRLRIEIQKFN